MILLVRISIKYKRSQILGLEERDPQKDIKKIRVSIQHREMRDT